MRINIKVEALPLHFLLLGGFLIAFGIFDLIVSYSVLFDLLLLIIGVLLITSQQRLEINKVTNSYSQFYWVLGMRVNNFSEQYQEIRSVQCTTGNYSQQYGKYNRRFISGIMYMGYIEVVGQENLYVGQNKSKGAMIKKLKKVSAELNVPLEDKTNEK